MRDAIEPETNRERQDAVIQAVSSSGWQALVCYSPTDVLLLTGYWPVMGSSIALATSSGDIFCIVPEDEAELAGRTSRAALIPYRPEELDRLTEPAQALVAPMKQLVGQLKLGPGKIGTTLRETARPAAYQSSNLFHTEILSLLQTVFDGSAIVSADAELARLRAVLTGAELQLLGRACALAGVGFSEAQGAIAPGRLECDVAAEIEAAFARVANRGFERGRGFFYCMSGPNAAKGAAAYARTRDRMLQTGDTVMIHANTAGDGLWTDITRTYVLGEPSERQRRMQAAIAEARSAALHTIAPGARAADVDAAARDVLTRHGFGKEFKHAAGHGVGFTAANPNAIPRVHPRSPDVLEAGMTFNIEPAIYFDGVEGMRHCDLVACTDAGAAVLTDF